MTTRCLFGPVTQGFAEQHLRWARHQGNCLAFNSAGDLDMTIDSACTWEKVLAGLPDGRAPDFLVLYLPYTIIPAALWSAPVPIIGLAPDWNLQWHYYRRCLPRCDLVLTDTMGVEVMQKQGMTHGRVANLFGLERAFLNYKYPDEKRDIDILFVGNCHPAVQRERLSWLRRLSRLAVHRRVVIRQGVFGDDYRNLLGRSLIVFNRGIRGEVNKRAFEAAAAGALLFQEKESLEVEEYFRDREACVLYDSDNLEELLEYYLDHESERAAIAANARERAQSFSFEHLWDKYVAVIEEALPELRASAKGRTRLGVRDSALLHSWQSLGSGDHPRPVVSREVATALVAEPRSATLHHAMGFAEYLQNRGRRDNGELAEAALRYFRRALDCDANNVLASLNLAEALLACGRRADAQQQAERTLAILQRPESIDNDVWDSPHFPPGFDFFRVEWERAASQNAGNLEGEVQAKCQLVRWRLHALLAELSGDLSHTYESVLARPDLPTSAAALGKLLLKNDKPAQAVPHLRQAVSVNPFDLDSVRALFHTLGNAGDGIGQRRLASEYRLLRRAAPDLIPPEPWLTHVPAVGDELVSIIILCCNEVEVTRLCLQSLSQHTRQPFELILVDNGSTDETPGFLEQVRTHPGPGRVEIIRNETNVGFPAGCNQGLARSRGHYVVFLNNDTVVTAGWLDGLIARLIPDWPSVGLVGAVSNYTAAPQQVATDYADLSGLESFAARHRTRFAGQALEVERLKGFCLLARRDVLDQIGGFDERFGLGFFDDDDLSVRARLAGFKLLVALDVFIHHFGSRTFRQLGVDCQKQLAANFEQFREKWGPEHTAGYRLQMNAGEKPEGKAAPGMATSGIAPESHVSRVSSIAPHPSPRTSVSLCMIVKNEEDNLPACLQSVADLVQEIVIADTGSTDRTREIAAGFGVRVVEFPWVDSFSAARNASLESATGDWIFWMDADDRLDEANREKLQSLFGSLRDENAAFSMKCVCLPDPQRGTCTVVDHIRLFRNHPGIRWQYSVHEQILPAVRQQGGIVRFADVMIHHVGYQDPALRKRKLERDLRLLHLEDAQHPDDPFTLFNLGSVFQELGKLPEALSYMQRSLERSHPNDSIVRKLFALITQSHRHLGEKDQALAACLEGRRFYPADAELLFQEGLVSMDMGKPNEAERAFLMLLSGCEGDHFASVDQGLRGFKARHNLAHVYAGQGRTAEAEAQWRVSLQEQPEFSPAWIGLGDLAVTQGRWDLVEEAASHLANGSHAPVDATVLRGRMHLARRDFTVARQYFEDAIVQDPQSIWPRLFLSHVLLQEGRDWDAAERVLRDILEIDPGNIDAKRNLSVLLSQKKPTVPGLP